MSAPTGSGKTLAYVLPLVQALRNRTVPRIRALVLLPVQELATQVREGGRGDMGRVEEGHMGGVEEGYKGGVEGWRKE